MGPDQPFAIVAAIVEAMQDENAHQYQSYQDCQSCAMADFMPKIMVHSTQQKLP
jgi:hypothetical protein